MELTATKSDYILVMILIVVATIIYFALRSIK